MPLLGLHPHAPISRLWSFGPDAPPASEQLERELEPPQLGDQVVEQSLPP